MVNEVVMSKRLFDHGQLKVVQGLEHGRVTQRVSTIAVDMNRRIRETFRTFRTISSSQPGRNFNFTRRKPWATASPIALSNSSI